MVIYIQLQSCFQVCYLLTCGKTICRAHSIDVNNSVCPLCPETHVMPSNGFPVVQIVQEMLEIELDKFNINFSQFDDCNMLIKYLSANLYGIEMI